MFTRTTELAFRALLVLALEIEPAPVSPQRIAAHLDCSPTYLSKTLGLLVKARILKSVRGAHGGVLLARKPADISMLDVVQACQGLLEPDHCKLRTGHTPCAYHRAVSELHEHSVQLLSRYSLADISGRSQRMVAPKSECRLAVLAANPRSSRRTGSPPIQRGSS